MQQDHQKKLAAEQAIEYIEENTIIGVGTGSTVNYFIEHLGQRNFPLEGAVASSVATEKLLKKYNIPVYDLNTVGTIAVYIDGADEVNAHKQLIKGGGGALTREKIIAAASERFVCIVDHSKQVKMLGQFPLPVEVIPMARSYVAREIVKLEGDPDYRRGFVTDNGNIILDIHNLKIMQPIKLEQQLNQITGVVTNGLFAARAADVVLVGSDNGVNIL